MRLRVERCDRREAEEEDERLPQHRPAPADQVRPGVDDRGQQHACDEHRPRHGDRIQAERSCGLVVRGNLGGDAEGVGDGLEQVVGVEQAEEDGDGYAKPGVPRRASAPGRLGVRIWCRFSVHGSPYRPRMNGQGASTRMPATSHKRTDDRSGAVSEQHDPAEPERRRDDRQARRTGT